MKKSILILGCSIITLYGFSQADVVGPVNGHKRQPGRYVGWAPGNNSVAGPLDIRNDFNEPIDFYTNGIQHMKIMAGTGSNSGFIGLGPNLTGLTPGDRLHLMGGNDVMIRFSNGNANVGLRIGTELTGIGSFLNNIPKFGSILSACSLIIINSAR